MMTYQPQDGLKPVITLWGWNRKFELLVCLCSSSGNCQIPDLQGIVTEQILLPCTYNDSQQNIRNVFWRDRNGNIVLDIRDCIEDWGRVSSFPGQYSKGNFSITMKNLQLMDTSIYGCFIHPDNVRRFVNLTVSGESYLRNQNTPNLSLM